MVATPRKKRRTRKIEHSMLCVTGVYLRDITNSNMVFVAMHLNVSHLSVCFSCCVLVLETVFILVYM